MEIMDEALHILDRVYFGNTVAQWLEAGVAFVAAVLVFGLLRRLLERRSSRWLGGYSAWAVLLLKNTRRYVRVIIGLYLADRILDLPPVADRISHFIIVVGVVIQVAIWASVALRHKVTNRQGIVEGQQRVGGAPIGVLLFIGRLVIWSLAGLFALDNLGVNITALIAGLGVGGIAIALSVQTLLGDLISSLSIAFDRPFQIGDSLRIDDVEGRVEYVGVRSTRLRSVTGEQVILSNADMLKSRVRNMGRMPERRVLFRLQVAYDNAPEKVEQVAGLVRGVVESRPGTRFGQCALLLLGLSALEFEVVYHVANRADVDHAGTVDAVNQGIFRALSEAGIALAYPTQRVVLGELPRGQPAVAGAQAESGKPESES
ncbi:MAG: mechanosensitive ion channel family protein [Nevskiaceae bacterium]|jgi:small-conductance mechanosensitive channel|nr:mechanosensitive ion channel family protein [Nevskiaceae bacterium]